MYKENAYNSQYGTWITRGAPLLDEPKATVRSYTVANICRGSGVVYIAGSLLSDTTPSSSTTNTNGNGNSQTTQPSTGHPNRARTYRTSKKPRR